MKITKSIIAISDGGIRRVKEKKLAQLLDLIDSFNQIELHTKGKKKLKPATEFLYEI